jgi:hypothetical protein
MPSRPGGSNRSSTSAHSVSLISMMALMPGIVTPARARFYGTNRALRAGEFIHRL